MVYQVNNRRKHRSTTRELNGQTNA